MVLFAISLITFVIMHAIPGGPFDEEKMPLPEAVKQNILHNYGLDRPLPEQYVRYVWNTLHLDFGYPYQSPSETVIQLIARVWPVSAQLGGTAFVLAVVIGIALGIIASVHQNSLIDNVTTFLSTMGMVLPTFVIGIGLILAFSTKNNILPSGGWDEPKAWIMPIIALSLAPISRIARYTRISMLENLKADYVRTARAKGVSVSRILVRHVLKNALIPILTIAGPILIDLITGTIFVESVFRVPGLGRFWVTSTQQRDYPMLMGLSLLSAALISVTYLITDFLYVIIDPRVSLE